MTIFNAAQLVVDANGVDDITYYSGFLSGIDALRARIVQRLERFKGEWVFDRNAGVLRMPGDGVGKPPSIGAYTTWIRRDLEACPGVDRVSTLSVTFVATTGMLSAEGVVWAEGESLPVAVTLPSSVSGIGNVPPSTSTLVSPPSPTWVQ